MKDETKVVWMDALMGKGWADTTVDWKVVRWVDTKDVLKAVGMDGQMDASMVARLAARWADSTVEKMALLPVVRMVVHWVVRSVDMKDEMKVAWMDALMVAS